ncbi:MAG: extracellular solute-binding protein [Chloroflexi bacterium]|nr:extracellular solute-binding protein [Chloroflexota bacterium]
MNRLNGSEIRGVSRRTLLGGAALSGAGVLLAACGMQAGPSGDGEEMAQGDAPAKEEAKAPAAEGATPVLFWQWGITYVPGFEALVGEYNGLQQEVALTVEKPPGGYWDAVLAALAAQTGPDIFLINGVNIKSWIDGGRVVGDLSQFFAADQQATEDLGAVLPSFVDWYSTDGKASGTPWDYSTSNTQYNEEHVVAAGLTPPAELGDGWDWDAMQEYAEKLTQRDGENITRYGQGHLHGIETGWGNYIQMNGGSVLNEDRTRCTIASEEAIDAVQFCVDLVQKHRVAPTRDEYTAMREGGLHPSALMISGLVSIFSAGDWYWNRYKDHPDLDWDVTFLPKAPTTGQTGNNSNFRGTVMNPQTSVPDAAWKWLAHSLTKPVQDSIVANFNEVPARLDSALELYTSTEKSGPPASRAQLEDSLRATISLPTHDVVTWQQMIREGINPSMNPIFDNEIGVAEGLRQAQDQINALFDAAG